MIEELRRISEQAEIAVENDTLVLKIENFITNNSSPVWEQLMQLDIPVEQIKYVHFFYYPLFEKIEFATLFNTMPVELATYHQLGVYTLAQALPYMIARGQMLFEQVDGADLAHMREMWRSTYEVLSKSTRPSQSVQDLVKEMPRNLTEFFIYIYELIIFLSSFTPGSAAEKEFQKVMQDFHERDRQVEWAQIKIYFHSS